MGLKDRIKSTRAFQWAESRSDALLDLGAFLWAFLILALLVPSVILKTQAGILKLFTKAKNSIC